MFEAFGGDNFRKSVIVTIRIKTTSGRGKRPDYSATPTVRRQNRIPSLVFEFGCSDTWTELVRDAKEWLLNFPLVDQTVRVGTANLESSGGCSNTELGEKLEPPYNSKARTRDYWVDPGPHGELLLEDEIPDWWAENVDAMIPAKDLAFWARQVLERGEGPEEMFKPDESSTAGNTRGVCGIWHKAIHLTFLNPQTDSKMRVLIRGVGG
ncbi:hypothetical protein C8R43DRAFT_955101 [Mycena crocata]|nr:hypothetical protein C8R43DRAFT_955101 [Mycena crocata]